VTYDNIGITPPNGTGHLLLQSPEAAKVENQTGIESMGKAIHDFRSSLNIIIGYSELMLDDVLGKMTDEQKDGLKDILTSGRHLLDIVNDIAKLQTLSRS
jgi:signal transduction histidine kinase